MLFEPQPRDSRLTGRNALMTAAIRAASQVPAGWPVSRPGVGALRRPAPWGSGPPAWVGAGFEGLVVMGVRATVFRRLAGYEGPGARWWWAMGTLMHKPVYPHVAAALELQGDDRLLEVAAGRACSWPSRPPGAAASGSGGGHDGRARCRGVHAG